MSVIDTLIFNRTNSNLVAGDPKGKYDYVDYNRVGSAINYVASAIGLSGISAKTNWVNTDIPRASDINSILSDVDTIIRAVGLSNSIPTTYNNLLTITGANEVERALYDAYNMVSRIMRWQDVNNLQETWDTLDSKQITWGEHFLKPNYE